MIEDKKGDSNIVGSEILIYQSEMDYLTDLENGNMKEIYIAPVNTEAQRAGCNIEILTQWLMLARKGMRMSRVLEEKQIKNIAIYGCGILGRQLYEELADSSIEVRYFIVKNRTYIPCGRFVR